MMTVYKYPLPTPTEGPHTSVSMPADARILHIHEQAGMVCLWALVDPSLPKVTRNFFVYGTGHPMPEGIVRTVYLGTVHFEAPAALVFHVFELP